MRHAKDILAGLAALIAFLAVLAFTLGNAGLQAYNNNQKQQDMMRLCIDQGYTGWIDPADPDDPATCV